MDETQASAEAATAPGGAEDTTQTPAASVSTDDLKAFISKVEHRLGDMGRQLAKANERAKAMGQPAAPKDAPAPDDVSMPDTMTRADFQAGLAYERTAAKLPDAVQDDLREQIESGLSYRDAAAMAALVLKSLDAAGGGRKDQTPQTKAQGKSGTPAPNTSAGPEPSTWGEYLELRKTNPKKAQALWDRPDFDPTKLQSAT